jgi:hypothetical protein
MKLNNQKSKDIRKALFVLALLLFSTYIECSEKIKLQKTISKYERLNSKSNNSFKKTTKRTNMKTRMDIKEKLKNLLIGFLAALASKALSVKDHQGIQQMVVAIVDWRFELTFSEFKEIKDKMIKENPCDPEAVKEVIGSQYEEIQIKCAEWETIVKMDSNEFSSLDILFGKIRNVISDNEEYMQNYLKFKRDKEAFNELDINYTKIYKQKTKEI